jgi:subtilisin family serine protease
MAKKGKYEVVLPPIDIEQIDFKTLQSEVLDYWHGLVKTESAFKETKGEGVVVFVLDTTYKTDHADLKDNLLLQYAASFIDGPGDDDTHGHGIHCLGLVGGVDNEIGIVGAAPKVKLVPVRVLNNSGGGTWTSVANGVRYAVDVDLGPYNDYKRVISMSLGGSQGNETLRSAMQYAKDNGVYSVVAAGNSGYGGRDTVNYPGAYDDLAITVSSISKGWQPSSFSSGGKAVDVASFGERIYSTYKNGTYARLSGTSMATPIVAGLVALILSKYKEYKPSLSQLESYLKLYARDLITEGEDDQTGAGAIVIDKYMQNSPDSDTPDNPDNPDEPTEPVKPKRTLNLAFNEDFTMVWGPNFSPGSVAIEAGAYVIQRKAFANTTQRNVITVKEIKLDVESTKMFDTEYDVYLEFMVNFFRNRGLVLSNGSDSVDAAKYTLHFLSMFLKRAGMQSFIKSAVFVDEAGRVLDWPDGYQF